MNKKVEDYMALEMAIKDLERKIANNVTNETYKKGEEAKDLKKLDKLKAKKNKRPMMVTN